MAVDACVLSRAKEFKFRVEFNGFPAALIQEFDPGARSIAVTEHAGAGQNYPCKEAGMLKYGNARVRNVMPIAGIGKVFFDRWMDQAQDPMTGNGQQPSVYRKSFSLYEMDGDDNDIRVTEFYGAFPVNHNLGGNKSGLTENKDVIDEIEIAYNKRVVRDLG